MIKSLAETKFKLINFSTIVHDSGCLRHWGNRKQKKKKRPSACRLKDSGVEGMIEHQWRGITQQSAGMELGVGGIGFGCGLWKKKPPWSERAAVCLDI